MKKKDNKMFAIKAIGKEVKDEYGVIIREQGKELWVCYSQWINDKWCFMGGNIKNNSKKLKIFMSKCEADKFCKRLKSNPSFNYGKSLKIVELKPVYKQVLSHYEPMGE